MSLVCTLHFSNNAICTLNWKIKNKRKYGYIRSFIAWKDTEHGDSYIDTYHHFHYQILVIKVWYIAKDTSRNFDQTSYLAALADIII